MDIDGVSSSSCASSGTRLLRSIFDLYRLTAEQPSRSRGRRSHTAPSNRSSSRSSNRSPRVLFGPNAESGLVLAHLALHFGTVDALMSSSQEQLEEIDGIGPDRAELIAEWFADDENRALVETCAARVAVREGRPTAGRGAVDGSPYVITGTLEATAASSG
jgi:DNA ligase (NAD+)